MRVRVREVDHSTAPSQVQPYLGQTLTTVGADYEVHAMSVFEGVVLLQVIDDVGYPGWKPAWLFDVLDSAMPSDWICSTFHDEPSLVVGPSFVAAGLEGYQAMVELEPKQVDLFWRRVDQQRERDGDA